VGDAKADLVPQGKRKREALGEVTSLVTNNKSKNGAVEPEGDTLKPIKGKDKELPKEKTVVTRKAAATTHTAVEPRQPLRTVLGQVTRPATRSTTVAPKSKPVQKVKDEPKIEVHEDILMTIDPALESIPEEKAPVTRQVSTRRVVFEPPTAEAVAHHSEIYRRSSKLVAQERLRRPEKVIEEEEPICKKQRTSSEPPEEVEKKPFSSAHAEIEAYSNEEPEADPEGDQWYDIDAEDADDPLMASEYVIDIVKYMRELEVSKNPFQGFVL
jgi:G2/mitotic-specific cyclin 2